MDDAQFCLTILRPEISTCDKTPTRLMPIAQPIFTSQKIKGQFKPKELKPPTCGLHDADYVSSTSRHLLQRDEHGKDPKTIKRNFKTMKKCQSKQYCLGFEMLSICKLKPKLNKQSDLICVRVFI
ncbi:unnamed protein product [Pocillopora meandrina]|uniref:Uncharacterized protein n=1 Tax=Pocillopora meandrina TaxID=46732 RepID=A0AAU9WJ90_9CNID|nr:unnamed protein product [Pocillopora meandrina]